MDLGAAMPALLLTVGLLIANAFFVAAEFALVRVRETQLKELAEEGSGRARLGHHLSTHIDEYLSACQVGITAASLALGIVGEPAVAKMIEPLFHGLIAVNETLFHVISFAIAYGVITYLHIVVGEQAPKYYAIQRALPTTLWSAYPLHWFTKATSPFIWVVNASANRLLRALGIAHADTAEVYSEEELKMLVASSTRRGVLQESERILLQRSLDFADTLVRQVMVPRTEIVGIEHERSLRELRDMTRDHPFTRFPVFHEDLDHIVGVFHIKDLVPAQDLSRPVRDVMRRPVFLPDTTRLDRALARFKQERMQLGIVVDEFGGTAGLVTMEDVLEQLVGEVQDEFDRETPHFRTEPGGTLVVDGLASVAELRERLGIDLDGERFDTVGGLVFGRLGRLARVGDTVEIGGHRLSVTAVDGRRVAQVRIQRPPRPQAR